MSVFVIKEFSGGLADFENRGVRGSFKFGTNLDIRKQVDSLSSGQALVDEGLASSASPSLSVSPSLSESATPSSSPSASSSPTPSPSASVSPSVSPSATPSTTGSHSVSPSPSPSAGLATVFEDLIRFFVKGKDGYTYGLGNRGHIYRRDGDAYWEWVYKDVESIKGAAEWYSDNGKTYLYWATDNLLHRKEMPGRADWNDVDADEGWPKQNLESADWHTMRECGGSLIIANGPYLALVGYDSSYTNEALDLIPGNIAKTIVERNGRTIVGTGRVLNATKSINAAIDTEVQLAQVGDDGEIFYANMTDSVPVKRFPGGGKVNPGGVCNEIEEVNFFEWEQIALTWIDKQAVGNLALFAVYDADSGKGGIYSYGRKNKNHPFVLNLDHQLDADELGAITSVDGTVLVSYQDGTDYGVMAVDTTAKDTGTYESLDLVAPVKKPGNITDWKYAEVFCSPLVNGSSISFYYKLNKTGDWIQAYMESGGTVYNTALGTKAVFFIGAAAQIIEVKLVLTPVANSSPEVHFIKLHFD